MTGCDGDHLNEFHANAAMLLDEGYYDIPGDPEMTERDVPSLRESFRGGKHLPIMAEVKIASPSHGGISSHGPGRLIDEYMRGGASAISVLTEPKYFQGSVKTMAEASGRGVPIMMKDFVIDERQLLCARTYGASAVLMIEALFGDEGRKTRDDLIDSAHSLGLEVVIEGSNEQECMSILSSEADVLAYNQRNLRDLGVSEYAADEAMDVFRSDGRPFMGFSLMKDREDVLRMRDLGVSAVLLGSALSSSRFPYEKLLTMKVCR